MSEIVGNRPPEETNTQENAQIYTELPADVFAENDRETISSKELVVDAANVVITGIRARIAERRADKSQKTFENIVRKTELGVVRRHNANREYFKPWSGSPKDEEKSESRKKEKENAEMRHAQPKSRRERRQETRLDEASRKKAVADVYAYRTEQTFGTERTARKSGALTSSERRQEKRAVRKAYKKGDLSAAEARLEKLKVDAAPIRLDQGFRKITEKAKRKADKEIKSRTEKPLTEKMLKRRLWRELSVVDKHSERADHLAEQRAAKQAELEAKKKGREHSFKDPEYYFDTTNILSLKDNIANETDRRYTQAIANAIGQGEDGSDVSRDQIEANTELEGIARYFGFDSWREAEEKVPGWLMDAVMNMYGMSVDELLEYEAPVLRRPTREAQSPMELEHDETISISDLHDIDSEMDEELFDDDQNKRAVNFFAEMAKPENRPELYDNEIAWVAAEIEAQLEELLNGVTDPAEKRQIIDQVYTEQIAKLLTIPSEKLKDPDMVPSELTSQILADIKKARKDILEINKIQDDNEPSEQMPEVKPTEETTKTTAPVKTKRETISRSSKREVTDQERNAGSSLDSLRNIIND